MATYILVDLANLFHRSRHAVQGDMATKSGMAMHIAFNSFKKMWNKFDADHIVVCLEGHSWRKAVYPAYKANRKVDDALRTKKEIKDDEFFFETMKQFAEYLDTKTNVTVIREPSSEADDLIARWIDLHPDDKHVIFSGDTDFYQLLSENVWQYDGVKDHTITINSVTDKNNEPVMKTKIVSKKDPKTGRTRKEKSISLVTPPNPEYELFKKTIRGDSSDNIMTAYPGAREKGTSKKPGIIDAFEDRDAKGYNWNSFMLTEWDKTVMDNDGEPTTKKVRVLDEYKINDKLINLRAQPDDIKEKIDHAILTAVQKDKVGNVGIRLIQFCEKMSLVNISKNPTEYAQILNSKYK